MVKLTQHSFLGGQLDWEMMGRQDVEKYQKGATLLKNVVLHKRGAAFKRPGTNYLWSVTDRIASDKYRLVPFASTQTQGWALLFTSSAIYAVSTLGVIAVTTPTGFSSYSGDEVNELDYCQCGDIVYIAHRNHPPAMIKHTVSGTSHSFVLTIVDLDQQNDGIPSISKATVSKSGITYKGPSYTEQYKVTAVYDGVETYPSAAYSNSNCQDYDSSYETVEKWNNAVTSAVNQGVTSASSQYKTYVAKEKSYSGTAYTLPWTESQKISLTIRVGSRTLSDGTTQSPEQIRIYRKTGSFYGLVGIVDTSTYATKTTSSISSFSPTPTRRNYCSTDSYNNAVTATGLPYSLFGLGIDGFTVPSSPITLTLSKAANRAIVTLNLGHCSYVENTTTETIPPYYEVYDYDATKTYNTNDWVIYEYYSWRCKADGVTGLNPSARPDLWEASSWSQKYGMHGLYLVYNLCTYGGNTYKCIAGSDEQVYGAFNLQKWALVSTTVTSLNSITYTFTPCGASQFQAKLGTNGTTVTESITTSTYSASTHQKTITKASGENEDVFRERAKSEAEAWLATFNDTDTVSFDLKTTENGGSSTVTITPNASSIVINNVTATGETTVSLPSSLTWEDKYYTPDVSVTPPSEADVMAASGDYPGCVCLSQQRLIWASTTNDPARVFMSEIGALYTYSPHDVQIADDPIDFQVSATQFPKINHIVELKKLVMFNGASEWIVDSASTNQGITFETIRATQHSCIGSSASLKPIVCNNVLLFAERTGQAVRQYGYELEDDGFGGNDISIFSQSIFNEKKIVAWAYQQHPHSTCWCVLSDGTMASLTFNREQQCIAWATHVLGGGGLVKDIVCTQAVIGNDATIKDTSEILLLVKRGSDYHIEQFRPEPKDTADTPAHFVCMDAVKTIYPGTTTRSGATIVDLSTMQIVSSMGSTGTYAEGYPFDTRITTVYPVVANEIGMAQMDVKCVQYANLRLMRSVGGYVKNVDTLDSVATALTKTTFSVDTSGTAAIPTVDERVLLPGSENRDGRITIFQNAPYPFGVTLVETDIDVEEHR